MVKKMIEAYENGMKPKKARPHHMSKPGGSSPGLLFLRERVSRIRRRGQAPAAVLTVSPLFKPMIFQASSLNPQCPPPAGRSRPAEGQYRALGPPDRGSPLWQGPGPPGAAARSVSSPAP